MRVNKNLDYLYDNPETGLFATRKGDAAKGIRAFKDGLSDDGKKDGPQDGVSSLPRTDTEKEELKR